MEKETVLTLTVVVKENSVQGYAYTINPGSPKPTHSEWFSDLQEMGEDLGVMICEGLWKRPEGSHDR